MFKCTKPILLLHIGCSSFDYNQKLHFSQLWFLIILDIKFIFNIPLFPTVFQIYLFWNLVSRFNFISSAVIMWLLFIYKSFIKVYIIYMKKIAHKRWQSLILLLFMFTFLLLYWNHYPFFFVLINLTVVTLIKLGLIINNNIVLQKKKYIYSHSLLLNKM